MYISRSGLSSNTGNLYVYGAANKHTISFVTYATTTYTIEDYYFPDIRDLLFNTLSWYDRKAKEGEN